MPRPPSSGFALIRDKARWPHTTPAIDTMRKRPQQNPDKPKRLAMRETVASGSFLRRGTITAAAGVAGVAGFGVVALAGAALTPGTVKSAAHPAAPSYQA